MGGFDFGQLAIPLVAIGIVVALLLVAAIYSQFYIKVPPDQVAVITGGGKMRTVWGGSTLRKPVVERVDYMSLAPFEIDLEVRSAISQGGVAVNVQGRVLVRFDSSQESLQTSTQRFLRTDRESLRQTFSEILAGHMRSIISGMTIEQLNQSRDDLTTKVKTEAEVDLRNMGLTIDVLVIQHISDDDHFIESLGRKRVAEVIRDAEIGEAEAKRESQIKSAEARQLGAVAEAQAAATIAEAERERDVRKAQAQALVQAEQATAAQAGPLAEANARKGVVTAEVAVEAERVKAETEVAELEVRRTETRLQAQTVKPAEAAREAARIAAEGERLAMVERANGTAQSRTISASAEAEAAKVTAGGESEAIRLKGTAEADARTAQAGATRAEMEAEAGGIEAKLLAEAKGKAELATALSAYNDAAFKLEVAPALIAKLPEIMAAIAGPLGNVKSVTLIGGGGEDPMSAWGASVPRALATGVETLKAVGIDLPAILSGGGNSAKSSTAEVSTEGRDALEDIAGRVSDPTDDA